MEFSIIGPYDMQHCKDLFIYYKLTEVRFGNVIAVDQEASSKLDITDRCV
jgi:hypothetical protein